MSRAHPAPATPRTPHPTEAMTAPTVPAPAAQVVPVSDPTAARYTFDPLALGGGYFLMRYTEPDFTTGPKAPQLHRATLGWAEEPDAAAPQWVDLGRLGLTGPQAVKLWRRITWIRDAVQAETSWPVHGLDVGHGPIQAGRIARLRWNEITDCCPHPGLG